MTDFTDEQILRYINMDFDDILKEMRDMSAQRKVKLLGILRGHGPQSPAKKRLMERLREKQSVPEVESR